MYRLSRPAASLAPFIEHYWHVNASVEQPFDLSVDVFVDARADLIFNFGVAYERTVLGGRRRRIATSNLDAQRLEPIRIAQRGAVRVTGVRFRTAGLAPFVAHSVDAWNNRTIALARAFGDDALALEAALEATHGDAPAQQAALDAFFTKRFELSASMQTVLALKSEIEASHGTLRIDALADKSGASQRSVDRLFRKHLGFSPKTFARVVRFQRALERLKTEPGCPLASIAAECGYYDQSHFVRDFKRFGGTIPTQQVGYFPATAPQHFSPNLVRFVQDERARVGEPRER